MKYLFLTVFSFFYLSIFGQIQDSEQSVFKVEFEKFKPSNQDQIREFEGKTTPVKAADIDVGKTF